MAKQKFQCKGVVRKTGKRVAVKVSAESKEAAIKIAAEHGVAVEQIRSLRMRHSRHRARRGRRVPATSGGQDARAWARTRPMKTQMKASMVFSILPTTI